MRRRLLRVLVCLCMLLTLMPGVVLADETGATVTGASGEVSAADGVWTLDGGAYTVTGTATDSQAIVLTGGRHADDEQRRPEAHDGGHVKIRPGDLCQERQREAGAPG